MQQVSSGLKLTLRTRFNPRIHCAPFLELLAPHSVSVKVQDGQAAQCCEGHDVLRRDRLRYLHAKVSQLLEA